jgi:hypothetical protein
MIQRCAVCRNEFENYRKRVVQTGPGSVCDNCLLPPVPSKGRSRFGNFASRIKAMLRADAQLKALLNPVCGVGPTRILVDKPTCPDVGTFDSGTDKDEKDRREIA